MKIKVNTNISSEYEEALVTINAPELSEEIQKLIQYISNINVVPNVVPNQIVGNKNNEIYLIDLEKVICFFSKDKNNYVKTKKDTYNVKHKLYELEDSLRQKGFIRISHSCIINVKQVECFDTSILGTILVKLKDGSQQTVSKRNVAPIMKLLKEKRETF